VGGGVAAIAAAGASRIHPVDCLIVGWLLCCLPAILCLLLLLLLLRAWVPVIHAWVCSHHKQLQRLRTDVAIGV
jgi:hypothetical protein